MAHIAVLMGGLSSERDVSLSSAHAVISALGRLGHQTSAVDADRHVAETLARLKPDIAFNALHGAYGEDGCIQGILETLHIPYTHSGVLASAAAMHKPTARRIFSACGLRIAEGAVMSAQTLATQTLLNYPYVVKPLNEGSSIGVTILHDDAGRDALLSHLHPETEWLVERYIPGREIQVAVLGDNPLGAIEIRSDHAFYDYEAKYTVGHAQHIMPAPLSEGDYNAVLQLALKAHRALGCRGLTRTDFRFDDVSLGEPLFYILETNTQPGMTPLSLAPEIAQHAGISFDALVAALVEDAGLKR